MNARTGLPIADNRAVVRFIRGSCSQHALLVVAVVLANALAATAGLLVPRLLGELVDSRSPTSQAGAVDAALAGANSAALVVAGLVVVQSAFTFAAKMSSTVLGQSVLATAREYIVRAILRLPLSRVESASSGDLVTRVTRDVGTMSESVRWALPESIIASITVVLTLVAMVSNSPCCRCRRSCSCRSRSSRCAATSGAPRKGYLTEGGTYSRINTTLTETVEGARTVEALGLARHGCVAATTTSRCPRQAERYTMTLRNLLFAVMDVAFSLPRVLVLLFGAIGYAAGLGHARTDHDGDPLHRGAVGPVRHARAHRRPACRSASPRRPACSASRRCRPTARRATTARPAPSSSATTCATPTAPATTCCTASTSTCAPASASPSSGPSGSGKSTLGRLLSGIHGPRTGSVTVGGVELTSLPLDDAAHRGRPRHAGAPRLHRLGARQRRARPRGLDRRRRCATALRAVDALDWVERLPEGLDTKLGSGHQVLTPGRAQQIALARLILADPHTIVLDEATSLIDPRTARHLEGSMNALLTGRTVVAIAHRLHTAHDADRIAVVIDGRVAELGSHDELVAGTASTPPSGAPGPPDPTASGTAGGEGGAGVTVVGPGGCLSTGVPSTGGARVKVWA